MRNSARPPRPRLSRTPSPAARKHGSERERRPLAFETRSSPSFATACGALVALSLLWAATTHEDPLDPDVFVLAFWWASRPLRERVIRSLQTLANCSGAPRGTSPPRPRPRETDALAE